jgi:hypothetical protein
MEKPAFMRTNFYDVRVIMVIMRVIVEEILCQAMMEQISVLEWQLSGVCGHLGLRHVMPDIK